jgi:hypothetical protein
VIRHIGAPTHCRNESAPLREFWEDYLPTVPFGSIDPANAGQVRDVFYAGAASMLGLMAAEATPTQREASLNAVQAELQKWAIGVEPSLHAALQALRWPRDFRHQTRGGSSLTQRH